MTQKHKQNKHETYNINTTTKLQNFNTYTNRKQTNKTQQQHK